jgi:hypothetical protein
MTSTSRLPSAWLGQQARVARYVPVRPRPAGPGLISESSSGLTETSREQRGHAMSASKVPPITTRGAAQ